MRVRSKDIATGGTVIADEWFSKQDKPPKVEKTIAFQTSLNKCGDARSIDALLTDNIHIYSFRPFLISNVLLWKDLLQSYARVGGGGTRLRKEIISAYGDADTIGFAMAHAPKDLNPTLSQFVSFCWYYPDNDMCTRGNSHIYMNQYPGKNSEGIQNNVSSELLQAVSEMLNIPETEAAKEIVFYVYAILCSQVYLDEFEGALFTVNQSDKRARVPFIKDSDKFLAISALGKKIAELEKCDFKPKNILGFDYEGLSGQIPRDFHLNNSAHPFNEEEELLILSDGRTEIKIP
jgi:predicted helicase